MRYIILLFSVMVLSCTPASKSPSAFQVDPFWPKPLPNHWMLGEVAGVAVDKHDHIWILQRPLTLTARESGAAQTPPLSECCKPAPSVIEFDPEGNVVQAWGGTDTTQQWFTSEHGLYVDDEDHVWVGGNNVKDDVVMKFSKSGEKLLQIGEWGVSKGSNDSTHLGGPTDIAVDLAANEVYISDGYRNRRVIVFDATTGAYKRHWGAYGNKPDDSPMAAYVPGEEPSQSFRNPHSVQLAADGQVYIADRPNNRIQVFTKEGKFVKESFIARNTLNTGAVWDLAFSRDQAQATLYVADGLNMKIWILNRSSLEITGTLGEGGRGAGQFGWLHNIAIDSKGNLYSAEVTPGIRVQRFKVK